MLLQALFLFLLFSSNQAVKTFNGQYTMTTATTTTNNQGRVNAFVTWSWTQAMMTLSFGPSASSPRWLETYEFNSNNWGYTQAPTSEWLFSYGSTCTPNCASSGISTAMPPFDIGNTTYLNTAVTISATSCGATLRYTPKTGVWTNFVTTFDAKTDGTICAFTLTDGRTFSYTSGWTTTTSTISIPTGCQCNQAIDIMFLIDRSASITGSDMSQFRSFVTNFLSQLTISQNAVWVGMTHFSVLSGVGTTFQITGDSTSVTAGLNLWATQCPDTGYNNGGSGSNQCYGYGTATSAGMFLAVQNLYNFSARNVPKLIVTLTDGGQNLLRNGSACNGLTTSCDADINAVMTYAKSYATTSKPLTFICAGIGVACTNNVNACLSPRNILAYANGVVGNNLTVGSWSTISTLTDGLMQQTCQSSNNIASSTCTSTCCGLCICGVCQAPDSCGTNLCETYSVGSSCCTATTITNACGTPPNCTLYSCNKTLNSGAGGCVSSAQTCNVANTGCNGCTTWGCNPATGACDLANSSACPAPVDCQYTAWSDWSPAVCPVTCGGYPVTRTRSIASQPVCGGLACNTSTLTQSNTCGSSPCPVDCVWSSWGALSPCTQTCGTGSQTQTRTIITNASNNGQPCGSTYSQTLPCNTGLCPVNCVWGSWSAYGACSVSCGGGTQTSTRTISTPAANGGANCTGNSSQTQTCGTTGCPQDCQYSAWSSYSACSLSCVDTLNGGATGTSTRTRTVISVGLNGGIVCDNSTLTDTINCNTSPCPINCTYGDWSSFGACSVSCGGGIAYSTRTVNQSAQFGGQTCNTSDNVKSTTCNTNGCPKDCVYSAWSDWSSSPCSVTCETGTQTITRTVQSVAINGGAACNNATSNLQQTRNCTLSACPRDCTYNPWSDWSSCSLSCGSGNTTRSRTVLTAATGAGVPCDTTPQTQACNTQNCPIDCVVGTWGAWSDCSMSCGSGGTKNRTRSLTPPQYGGLACPTGTDNVTCFVVECPINCTGSWSDWSSCDCTSFNRTKVFTVDTPAQYGGSCDDAPITETLDAASCGTDCDKDCNGTWSSWTACRCSDSQRNHTWTITQPQAGNGAACTYATGDSVAESCTPQNCPVNCSGSWSDWYSCDCSGTGKRIMNFTVTVVATNGGVACNDTNGDTISEDCTASCPQPCVGAWTSWTTCSCDTNDQTRDFFVSSNATNGGADCTFSNNTEQTQPCVPSGCNVSCVGYWSEWEDCACIGTGQRNRTFIVTTPKQNYGADCVAADGDIDTDNTCAKPCVDCQGEWLAWTGCSCQSSTRTSTYNVSVAASGPPYAGVACNATNGQIMTESCDPIDCPVDCVGAWAPWGNCSCDTSTQNRSYTILIDKNNSGADCVNRSKTEQQSCVPQGCPVDCVGDWSSWGSCDCSTVQESRTYTVTTPRQNAGLDCPNASGTTDFRNCSDTSACPFDCTWAWTEWGNCDCRSNSQNRTVNVTQPSRNGGSNCPDTTDYQICVPVNCPVDCNASWTNFGSCPCETNSTWNRTYIIYTDAAFGGQACENANQTIDVESCTSYSCVQNCTGYYTSYSNCSCTTGTRSRTYIVTADSQNGGDICPASNNSVETISCTKPADCPNYGPTCNNASDCDDGKPCTIDACLLKDDGLYHCDNSQPTVCNDSDTCTSDICDPISGCTYPQRLFCDDFNVCTDDTCHPVLGCQHTNITCPNISACFLGVCHPTLGCEVKERECRNSSSTNNSCLSYSCNPNATNGKYCKEEDVCAFPIVFVGIAAGAIAGIVLGGIVAAALCSGATYAFAQQATTLEAVATTTNPLYAPSGTAGDNPMFVETPRVGGD